MRAMVLDRPGAKLRLEERPVPEPGSPTSGPDRRRTMTLRWTFDERCEDGLVAGYALKRCKQILEDPRGMGLPDPAAP